MELANALEGLTEHFISRSDEDGLMNLISPSLVETLKDITQMVAEEKVRRILEFEDEMNQLRIQVNYIFNF